MLVGGKDSLAGTKGRGLGHQSPTLYGVPSPGLMGIKWGTARYHPQGLQAGVSAAFSWSLGQEIIQRLAAAGCGAAEPRAAFLGWLGRAHFQ